MTDKSEALSAERLRQIIVALWIAVSFLNFGAINADMRVENSRWYCASSLGSSPRHEASVEVMLSLLPIAGSMIAVFGTGFCEHGFSWSISPCELRPL